MSAVLRFPASRWLLAHLAAQRREAIARCAPIAVGQSVLARLPGEWALRFVTIVAISGDRLLVDLGRKTPLPDGASYLDIPRRAVELFRELTVPE